MADLKVLVTGGAGFIGGHLVDKLVENCCGVTVLDNLSNGGLRNIRDHLLKGNVKLVEGDILNRGIVEKAVVDVDAVVHLAAIISVPFSVLDPKLTYEVNVHGTKILLDQCVASQVKRFILVSSCSVYGEPRYVPTDELHPTSPLSPYAESKLEAERVCLKNSDEDTLETVVLRLFNVYGLRQAQNGYAGVISSFAERLAKGRPLIIYGDGLQTRDFVHVSDVTEAIRLALNKSNVEGVFNIASGKPVEIRQLAEVMTELVDIENPRIVFEDPREGDIRNSNGDFSKAKKMLGYEPETKLRGGLCELLENGEDAESIVAERAIVS